VNQSLLCRQQIVRKRKDQPQCAAGTITIQQKTIPSPVNFEQPMCCLWADPAAHGGRMPAQRAQWLASFRQKPFDSSS